MTVHDIPSTGYGDGLPRSGRPVPGEPPELYREALLGGHAAACVWGLGHIGWSTATALSAEGVRVVGYDTSPSRVARLTGEGVPETVTVSHDRRRALEPDILVHFIAVPTERHAEPYTEALLDVLSAVAAATAARRGQPPPLVVVESTITPGTVETLLLPLLRRAGLTPDVDLLLALAPRRDWFTAEGYGLREVDRVYGGAGPRSADAAFAVLSVLCDTLHRASGHVAGELVKCVENAYRHLEITLANQLSLAFPSVDMVEVLRLAGTKWNIGTFHPSFGTGGYCIPLSSRYLLQGAEEVGELSLLRQAVETDDRMRVLVAEAVAGHGPVLILGLAYKGGIKVCTHSPTVRIAAELARSGVPFSVHDPLYDGDEIERELGPGTAARDLTAAVRGAGTVLVVPDHPEFRGEPYATLLREERETTLSILDNHGVLAGQEWPAHVGYRRAGNAAWLGTAVPDRPSEPAGTPDTRWAEASGT
ncbi:UDP binding domain-containing protein [Streptosporangium sp. DT93]|uniref:UDP binding domain-containing protein n=1 Tax=Streptosporangium sp. DT93 TaxID=3393428 RepID=UPI003CED18E8